VRKRRFRLLVIGVVDLVVAGLSLGASVAVHSTRAAAGTAGAGAVFVTTGTNGGASKLQLDNLAAPGSPAGGFPANSVTGPIAINSTATLAVAGAGGASGSQINDVSVFNVSTGAAGPPVTLLQTGDTPVAIAMDPVNPNVGYVVERLLGFGGSIDRLALSGTSAAPSTLVAALPQAPNQIGITPTSIAVTPDGGTLLVGFQTRDYLGVDSFSTATGAWTGEWLDATAGFGRVADIAVSPSGQSVYVLTANRAFAAALPLPGPPPASSISAPSSPSQWATTMSAITNGSSLTVSPDGGTVYVGGTNFPAGGSSFVQALSASTGGVFATAPLPQLPADSDGVGGVVGVAASPSGTTILAYGFNASFGTTTSGQLLVYPLTRSGSSLTAGGPQSVGSVNLGAGGEVLGPESISVTPDQAPVAGFTAATGYAGSPTTFDASASSVRYGSITRYAWSFGDGATAVTSTPAVAHVYSAPGTDTVTLTETDSAGTSIPPAPGTGGQFTVDGPGQTASRRADQSASTQQVVTISAPGTPTTTSTTPTSTTSPTTPGTSPTTAAPGKSKPVLTLNPAVGPPGTIVTVTGRGFPKNIPITLSWSLSTGSIVVTTDSKGNLPASPLYILTPDILGQRYAVASSTPPVKAPFLVVPSTSEPGGDAGIYLFRSEGP
jgi:PKD repeat protein